uniref:Uncharacterized protein n=1 Tax=Anguilla anguilla TaxID=7936 RepID=A0A0E9PET9_ANGAN
MCRFEQPFCHGLPGANCTIDLYGIFKLCLVHVFKKNNNSFILREQWFVLTH